MFMNRGLLAVVYSLTVVLGLFTMLFPPPTILGILGLHYVFVYGLLLFIGGIMCLIGVIKPNYKIEMVFLWFVAAGYLFYDSVLWLLAVTRFVDPSGVAVAYGPPLAVAALTVFVYAKQDWLRRKNRDLIILHDERAKGHLDDNGMG